MGMFEVHLISLSPEQNEGFKVLAAKRRCSTKALMSQAMDEFLQRELGATPPDKPNERKIRVDLFR